MAEYIDVEKARAYVETDLKGDPVLQWLGRTMIEKLPKVEAVPVRENPVITRLLPATTATRIRTRTTAARPSSDWRNTKPRA